MDAVQTALVCSACSSVLEAGSDREDRSSDVCYVGDRTQEESTTWRCDEEWREATSNCPRRTTETARSGNALFLPAKPTYFKRPFTRFFRDALISKLKACNTWAELYSSTKDFEHSWHVKCDDDFETT